MKYKVREKDHAIQLRKKGLSYNEILKKIPVAKSSLSAWLKDLPLTKEEKHVLGRRIQKNIREGRVRAATQNHKNRTLRQKELYRKAQEKFETQKHDALFLLGVSLYWAEGSNKSPQFQFINTDPEMILFMYMWVQKYLSIPKDSIGLRLFMHKVYSQDECEDFWSDHLAVSRSSLKKTIFKPTKHATKQNINHKGCLRIEVSGVHHYHTMMAWKKALKQYILNDTLHPWLNG